MTDLQAIIIPAIILNMPKKVQKIVYVCDWCLKNYFVYPSRVKADISKGYKKHFCSRSCKYEWNKTIIGPWKGKKIPYRKRNRQIWGEKNPNWKGGRRYDKSGYILVQSPEHPYRDSDGYVREHRLVMEKHLGRYLFPTEVVHHINMNKKDNRLKNLILFPNGSLHRRYHEQLKKNAHSGILFELR